MIRWLSGSGASGEAPPAKALHKGGPEQEAAHSRIRNPQSTQRTQRRVHRTVTASEQSELLKERLRRVVLLRAGSARR